MSGKTLRSIVKNVPVELILSTAIPDSCYLCRFLECTSSCNLFNVRLEKKGHNPLRCEECKSIFNIKEYSTMEI